jgi:hypothetical protein
MVCKQNKVYGIMQITPTESMISMGSTLGSWNLDFVCLAGL